jgi:hypothetical protein
MFFDEVAQPDKTIATLVRAATGRRRLLMIMLFQFAATRTRHHGQAGPEWIGE